MLLLLLRCVRLIRCCWRIVVHHQAYVVYARIRLCVDATLYHTHSTYIAVHERLGSFFEYTHSFAPTDDAQSDCNHEFRIFLFNLDNQRTANDRNTCESKKKTCAGTSTKLTCASSCVLYLRTKHGNGNNKNRIRIVEKNADYLIFLVRVRFPLTHLPRVRLVRCVSMSIECVKS